jgi:mono/diheme cytochrome c family protein
LDPTEFPPERGRIIPPVDPKTLMAPSAELVKEGKELFEKNCIQCHGQSGHGDGAAAATMNPRPRNFTSPDGWVNGYDMPDIFKTLGEGIKGTSMNAFDYLSKRDRMALVHYVQSLGAFSHKVGSPEALEALSKELAAAGEKTPNKIPVSMAMAKLAEEFNAPPPLTVGREDRSTGGEILRRVITDPVRAAQILSETSLWRAGARDLAAGILPDTPGNGFSVSTATLSPSEWKALHAELMKRMKPE